MQTFEEKIETEIKDWEGSLKNKLNLRKCYNAEYKERLVQLKAIRSYIYKTTKEIRHAEQKIKFLKSKKVRVPSRIRTWNLHNVGKVLESFERV